MKSQSCFAIVLPFLLFCIPSVFAQHWFYQNTILADSPPPTNATNLPIGTCTPDIPCANAACCNGKSGLCGFGPTNCGPANCTSNCNATAECGEFAPSGHSECPLKVCCSQYGFCGTGDDFCLDGCQNNCGAFTEPSCDAGVDQRMTRRIGYYEGWAVGRDCMAYTPEKISAETFTHINYAFALISSSFKIIEMKSGDSDLWKRTTALKKRNPALKVFLSIGGWTFNDPPTSHIFSDMAGSASNIDTFIDSALNVMESYGFDGLDIDWEYPVADDRGGKEGDAQNYVNLMGAIKRAFSDPGYGLTFTAPSSYWYLQHFDLVGMLEHADWVNVMTYDLHGTWDGKDPWIGYVVGSHTNLTEIDAAFKLYWRVGVKPSQMVMGLGFYGRSFTLDSPDCAGPGCGWSSGANAGPCSNNPGTLMYAEIQSVLKQEGSGVSPVLDTEAAVKYITWDTNQWVSYDDAETFAIKMNYAADHCLAGSMVWSVDQDDDNYSALKGLYPDITVAGSGDIPENKCTISDCDAKSCGGTHQKVGTTTTNPLQPGKTCDRLICCPNGDVPTACRWRQGPVTSDLTCRPTCEPGEELITTQPCPNGGGTEAFCCETSEDNDPDNWCMMFPSCSSSPSCPSQNIFSNMLTSVIRGDVEQCDEGGNPAVIGVTCPTLCSSGQKRPYCCKPNAPYKNCKWYGSPPLCQDNSCPAGQIQIQADPQGDAKQPCSGVALRAFCCEPDGDEFLPVPFGDLFPENVKQGSETFKVEFDPDEGAQKGKSGAGTSSDMPTDDDENDEAFGEVFINSPKDQSVSSIDTKSDWVVTDCHPTSDQPQSVLMYCSKDMATSGCSHLMIGSAEHTIVKMPDTCGRGPYARVASLTVHSNQDVLTKYHQAKKPADEPVYLLSFDYNFAAIPDDNGPIYMRADVSDLPGYWDELVDSPAEEDLRRRWIEGRDLDERWWGSFKTWLNKMNTVEKDTSVSRNFHWSDTWTIFHKEVSCPGPPAFEASLDVSLSGQANLNTRYGFYLQATIVPPAINQAYVYFSGDAGASVDFVIKGEAAVTYDSSVIQFASFGFPGLYYPGLLTIGPSLVLNGYITGQISIQGQFTQHIGYQFPPIHYTLGKTGDDDFSEPVTPSSQEQAVDFKAGYNVELSGDLSIHLVPTVQLGISILGGAVMDAQAYVRADLYAGVRMNGSVSHDQAAQFCVGAYYGVHFEGGLRGNVLYFEDSEHVWIFYQNEWEPFGKCFSSVEEPHLNGRGIPEMRFSAGVLPGLILPRTPSPHGPAYIQEKTRAGERVILPQTVDSSEIRDSALRKRGSVPPSPGIFSCPAVNDEINTNGDLSDDDPYDDYDQSGLEDADYRRRSISDQELYLRDAEDLFNDTLHFDPHELVTVSGCNIKFSPLPYNNIAHGYYDLDDPTDDQTFDPAFTLYQNSVSGAGSRTYGREHIYEVQLLSMFMTALRSTTVLWQTNNPNYCAWLQAQITTGNNSPLEQMRQCLPTNTGPRTTMPYLENVANGVKASAINGQTVRSQKTFNKYTYTKKVAVMRSTAAVLSYLNLPAVRGEFVSQSNCVKGVWNTWYTGYVAANPGNAIPNGGINQVYSTWIQGIVRGIAPAISTALTNMKSYYSAQAGGDANAEQVDVNWGSVVNHNNGNSQVSANDLQQLVNYANANTLTWAGQFL